MITATRGWQRYPPVTSSHGRRTTDGTSGLNGTPVSAHDPAGPRNQRSKSSRHPIVPSAWPQPAHLIPARRAVTVNALMGIKQQRPGSPPHHTPVADAESSAPATSSKHRAPPGPVQPPPNSTACRAQALAAVCGAGDRTGSNRAAGDESTAPHEQLDAGLSGRDAGEEGKPKFSRQARFIWGLNWGRKLDYQAVSSSNRHADLPGRLSSFRPPYGRAAVPGTEAPTGSRGIMHRSQTTRTTRRGTQTELTPPPCD